MPDGIEFERLVAYACAELSPEHADQVRRVINESPRAAATLNRLRDLLDALGAGALAQPRPALVARLHALAGPAGRETVWPEVLRRVVASLVFDSWAAPATGLRGAGPRQLVFASDAAEVDLSTLPPDPASGGQWRIRGQATPCRDAVASAVVLCPTGSDAPVGRVAPDPDGQFVLTADRGVYDLHVLCGTVRVVVPRLEVG